MAELSPIYCHPPDARRDSSGLPGSPSGSGACCHVASCSRADCPRGSMARWSRDARLHRVHPGVYAPGPRRVSRSKVSWLAALLHAGPGAALSHEPPGGGSVSSSTGADPHVSAPGRARSRPGIQSTIPAARARQPSRAASDDLSERTLAVIAATSTRAEAATAVADAEYRGCSSPVGRLLGPDSRGLAALRAPPMAAPTATRPHPQRARGRFLLLCEAAGIELPE